MGTFVLDTNICVDLANGNLLEVVLMLPDKLVLPDVIIAELKEPEGDSLIALGYESFSLPSEIVQLVSEYAQCYSKPSRIDLFALATAKVLETTLLTGDGNLRKAAEQEQVDVHGLLWLLDKLFDDQIVSGTELHKALGIIVAKGARLPEHEVQHRLEKWNQATHRNDAGNDQD